MLSAKLWVMATAAVVVIVVTVLALSRGSDKPQGRFFSQTPASAIAVDKKAPVAGHPNWPNQ